jgi:mono/diheme cytochrome c family protein
MQPTQQRIHRAFVLAISCGVTLLAGAAPIRAADAQELFAKHCVPCHGKDGKAQSPAARKLGVKDLSLSKATDAEIEQQLIEGRKDNRGNQKMPPFRDKLSLEEIRSLIPLVKAFRK